MAPISTLNEQRSLLSKREGCQFVDSEEFCRLLLGFKRLIRADESSVEVRGLLDLDTGTRFLIEQEKLTPPPQHHP